MLQKSDIYLNIWMKVTTLRNVQVVIVDAFQGLHQGTQTNIGVKESCRVTVLHWTNEKTRNFIYMYIIYSIQNIFRKCEFMFFMLISIKTISEYVILM